MGETTDQIATDIHQKRADLQSNLEELETRMKALTDWREQFRRRPGAMITAALVGGVLLASMLGKRSSPGDV
jgi:hypothetical protein